MSRFYGSINGQAKTEATRRGSEKSGLIGHIRGWNVGVKVYCNVDENGKDMLSVYRTRGSNGESSRQLIAIVTEAGIEFLNND